MNRENIVKEIRNTLKDLGIPEHLCGVKLRPSEVHCDVAFGGHRISFGARSGTAEKELRANLERLAIAWINHTEGTHQIDLEEVIASAEKNQTARATP